MLPNYFRIIIWNNSAAATGAAGTVTARTRKWYINTSGVPIWLAVATEYSNAGAITAGNTDTVGATAFNNGGAANPCVGMEIEVTANVPAGTPGGPVSFYLQASVDGGVTWPDTPASAEPQGEKIASLNFTATGTQRLTSRIE